MCKPKQIPLAPLLLSLLLFFLATPALGQDKHVPESTGKPEIPLDQLQILIKPMTCQMLEVEAKDWFRLVSQVIREISQLELAVKKKVVLIDREIESKDAKDEGQLATQEARQALTEAEQTGDREKIAAAKKNLAEIEKKIAAAEKKKREAQEEEREAEKKVDSETKEKIKEAAKESESTQQPKDQVEKKEQEKVDLQKGLVSLREKRTALIERFEIVLTAWQAKGGETEEYRLYLAAVVPTIEIDISTGWTGAWIMIKGWLFSTEGGIKWAWGIGKFLALMISFFFLAIILAKATGKVLARSKRTSQLLRDFLLTAVKRSTQFIGLMVALSFMGINVAPVLALIGALGFVVGFALQGTLSNFASGILILIYQPFDIGDVVDTSGICGTVTSMSMVSTTIHSFDNKVMIVPNNQIWGGVITNVTGSKTRRVDLVFGIGYADDMDKAKQIMAGIMDQNDKILADPAPVIQVHELADSAVNFICRPWVKTTDYWDVYWSITRQVKEEFDRHGVSIPFPQRDVHIIKEMAAEGEAAKDLPADDILSPPAEPTGKEAMEEEGEEG